LTFDLLTPKVGHFMPLTGGPLVQICSQIGPFFSEISCSHNGNKWMDERPGRKYYASSESTLVEA